MNPLMREMAGSFVRAVLNIAAGWLVAEGILSSADAEKYVAGAALALVSLGLSAYQKYRMRTKLVTAMAMPAGVSENQVQEVISNRQAPIQVSLPKDEVSPPITKPPDPPKAA